MEVAVYQCALGGSDMDTRLQRLDQALRDPKAAKAELVVCPELFMSGYNVGDALKRLAELAGGPFAQAVAKLARRHGKAILYGYPELEGEGIYNSAACYGRDGALLANHRKLVLPPGFESNYFQRGDRVTFFTLGGFKFALLVCYDAEFPEAVRIVVQQGAQVVLAPTALKKIWESVATRMMPTRAFENGVYFIYANHAGREGEVEYLGGSCIVGPDGEDAARAGVGEEVISAALDAEAVKKAQARLPYLSDLAQLAPIVGR